MRLTLRTGTYDLTTRALVASARVDPDRDPTVPVCLVARGSAAVEIALAAGAELIWLPAPSRADLERCAPTTIALVLPDGDLALADAAGLPPDRVVAASLLVDVAGRPCPLPAMVAGVLRGGRVVRTDDLRAARRVCDVLAAITDAGAQ